MYPGKTTVVNKYHSLPFDLYIGRGSKWGNPFTHMENTQAEFKVETRDEAVQAYRNWVVQQPKLLEMIPELQGKTLCCFCKPKSCHGDVLSELANMLTMTNWIGEEYASQNNPEAGILVKKLTSLYMEGFHVVFELEQTSTTTHYREKMVEMNMNPKFQRWFSETAITELQNLMKTSIEGTSSQVSKLEFTIGLVEGELNWAERDMRSTLSTLINTLTGLTAELKNLGIKSGKEVDA
jgi:hypothetical protein